MAWWEALAGWMVRDSVGGVSEYVVCEKKRVMSERRRELVLLAICVRPS